MAWVYLVIAGGFEIGWAVGLKYTDGFTRFWPSAAVVVCLVASLLLLSLAMRAIPIGTAYAVWMGIGALGTVVAGALLFGEAVSPLRGACIALLLVALAGLKLTATAPTP